MQAAYHSFMEKESPRRARRRARLETLLKEAGGPAQAERDTGTKKSHFSAMLSGRRGLGDELAAKLEEHYGKPAGWFDAEDAPAGWPFPGIDSARFERLKDDQKIEVQGAVRKMISDFEQEAESGKSSDSQQRATG
jgi:hypothetical protein